MRQLPLKIGTKLTLVHQLPGQVEETYETKVVDFKDNSILIDYPTHKATKKTSFIHTNTVFKASFLSESQAVYEFKTKVVGRVKLNVPALALSVPEKEDIKRIQRREFVRVEATVDLAIHRRNGEDGFTSVTTDISGGGLSLIVPKGSQLEMNEIVDIWLVLRFQSGTYHYMKAGSEVVFSKERNGIHTCGVKFVDLESKDQQLIIRFCFEKQREMRKKELS